LSSEAAGERIVGLYRGWNALDEVIDCDVAPRPAEPNLPVYQSDDEVIAALEELREQVPTEAPPLLKRKLSASLMYLAVKNGEEVAYEDYIETTMGMRPQMVDETELQQRAAELDARLQEYGMGWDPKYRADYQKAVLLHETPAVFGERVKRAWEWATPKILGYVSGDIAAVEPILLERDEPWRAGILTDSEGNTVLEVNTHQRHIWYPGKVGEAMAHEPSHDIQIGGIWKPAIAEGRMNQALGATTLHTPETTQLEAVALLTSIKVLGDEKSNPAYTYQALYAPYYQQVMNNVGFMINTEMTDEAGAIAYMEEHFPLGVEDDPHKAIAARRDNLASKAYLAAYGLGLSLVLPVLDMPDDKQRQVMQTLYENAFTPQEVDETIKQAA
jgi:hypothetical protein